MKPTGEWLIDIVQRGVGTGRDLGPLTRTAQYKRRCGFVRHSGVGPDQCGAVEKVLIPGFVVCPRPPRAGFTPPLRGSQRGKGEARRRVGGGTCHRKSSPHRIGLRTNRSASSSGFPLGKPDPQGGSEFRYAPFVHFFNDPDEGGRLRLMNEGSTERGGVFSNLTNAPYSRTFLLIV